MYSKGFGFWCKQLEVRRFPDIFVSFTEQNKENMKKLTSSLICLFFVLFLSCTDDETIEEQVYQQQIQNFNTWASGEEGYDGTDDVKDL